MESIKAFGNYGNPAGFQPELAPIDYRSVANDSSARLAVRFRELSDKWKEETAFLSSLDRIVCHDSYLAIIGMGPQALPFILRDLKAEAHHWFTALKAIVPQDDPVTAADTGDIGRMAEAWVKWGEKNGYC